MAEITIPPMGTNDPIKDGRNQPFNWEGPKEKSDALHAFLDAGRKDQVVISVDGRSGCVDVRGRKYENSNSRGDGVEEIHGRIIVRRADGTVTIILDGKTGSIETKFLKVTEQVNGSLKIENNLDVAELTGTKFLKVTEQVNGNLKIQNNLDVAELATMKFLEVKEQVNGNLKIQNNLDVAGLTSTQYLNVAKTAVAEDLHATATTQTKFLEVDEQVNGSLTIQETTKTKNLEVAELAKMKFLEVSEQINGSLKIQNNLEVAELAKMKFLEVSEQINGGLKVQETTKTKNLEVTQTATVETLIANSDIILQNADCAEEFDSIEKPELIEPGTVMVLGQAGKICKSSQAYDKKVVGVISGAGDYKPGLILDKQPLKENRCPIALMGKVYCKVDANQGAIEVGDLLTTSPTPGHAMKAEDPFKAFGAVIGKALSSIESGQGLIPILVTLQ
jgi:hypothetical protein